jgi:prolyl-tRNA synthetase
LGTRYTDKLGCAFSDENGESRPVIMGSYGIGVGRLLACIAEQHHDDHGLVWPAAVAPFQVHLVRLGSKSGVSEQAAEQLYQDLQAAGLEVLFDDREDSAGVKFMDADLIGLPLRITAAERALKQGGFEFKRRAGGAVRIVPQGEAVQAAKDEIQSLLLEERRP